MRAQRKARTEVSVERKRRAINDIRAGKTTAKRVADELGVAKSTVSEWMNSADKICRDADLLEGTKAKRVYRGRLFEVNSATAQWVQDMEESGVTLSVPMIQKYAKEKADQLEKDFNVSNGWMSGFMKRNNLSVRSACGESEKVVPTTVEDWFSANKDILSKYDDANTFNMDETALFYRSPLKRVVARRGVKTHGKSANSARVTVALCVSKAGEKLEPLIIGRSERPRCWSSPPRNYKSSPKAWMTTSLFKEWLLKFDHQMREAGREVLLLVDNCSTHKVPEGITNSKVLFLPPNCTSRMQPLDQGIIRSFKAHFTKIKVEHAYHKLQLKQFNGNFEDWTVATAHGAVLKAWKSVTSTTIVNCWRHGGFLPAASIVHDDGVVLEDYLGAFIQEHTEEQFDDIVERLMDEDTVGMQLQEEVEEHNGHEDSDLVVDGEDKEEGAPPTGTPSRMEVVLAVDVLWRATEGYGSSPEVRASVFELKRFANQLASQMAQKKITDYFK